MEATLTCIQYVRVYSVFHKVYVCVYGVVHKVSTCL